jgi:AAA family ATP:ADP antiporter
MMANVALVFSGQYVKYVSSLPTAVGGDHWGNSLKLLMGAVVAGGALVMSLYAYMQRSVLTDPACIDQGTQEKRKKNKPRLSFTESATFLAKSPYIRNLAILVISYGMCINIGELHHIHYFSFFITIHNNAHFYTHFTYM